MDPHEAAAALDTEGALKAGTAAGQLLEPPGGRIA
jgi:hypothetical protein